MIASQNQKFLAVAGFYVIFAILPIAIWVLTPGSQLVFYDWFFFLTTVIRLSGLVGITMFAGNLLLSGRYKFLDSIYGGLDTVFRFHRDTGYDVWALLSIHVTALLVRMGIFYVQTHEWYGFQYGLTLSVSLGILAYLGLISIVVLSIAFSRKLKYEWLKFIHKFLGMVLAVGTVHAMLLSVSFSANLLLEVYVVGLISLAGVSYLFRTILWPYVNNRKTATINSVKDLGGGVTEVAVSLEDSKQAKFIPGQFIFIGFRQEGFGQEDHPFSLTGSALDSTLRISAKGVGDFTKKLPELKAGGTALIQGPFGGFSFLRSARNEQIWIAGGIGITPFMSMARTIADSADEAYGQFKITLYYSGQTDADLVYLKELQQIAKKRPNIIVVPWVSSRDGYISAESVEKRQNIQGAEFFICGPPAMMDALVGQLKTLGVSRRYINTEKFALL